MTENEPNCYICEYFPECRIIEVVKLHVHDLSKVLMIGVVDSESMSTAFAREVANYCNRYKETEET